MSVITGPGVPPTPIYYSPAVYSKQGADTVYTAGNCGVDPVSGAFIEGTVKDRTTQAMKNIESVLKAAGMGLGDIVSVTIYLSKYAEDFADMNEAYVAMFPEGKSLPARACVGVAALPKGTDVEISCVSGGSILEAGEDLTGAHFDQIAAKEKA